MAWKSPDIQLKHIYHHSDGTRDSTHVRATAFTDWTWFNRLEHCSQKDRCASQARYRPFEENKSDPPTPGHIEGMASACTILLIMVLIYRYETPTYSPVEPSSLLALLLYSICDAICTLLLCISADQGLSLESHQSLAPYQSFLHTFYPKFVAVGRPQSFARLFETTLCLDVAGFCIALIGPFMADGIPIPCIPLDPWTLSITLLECFTWCKKS